MGLHESSGFAATAAYLWLIENQEAAITDAQALCEQQGSYG